MRSVQVCRLLLPSFVTIKVMNFLIWLPKQLVCQLIRTESPRCGPTKQTRGDLYTHIPAQVENNDCSGLNHVTQKGHRCQTQPKRND